jgi:UTP:GlnB (protein PII) uridylyltransferase
MGDSRYVVEPNVKEGKGGLRDLQTLDWIAGYGAGVRSMRGLVAQGIISPASHREYRRSYLWFSQVRAMMHCLQGRAEERLSLCPGCQDRQVPFGQELCSGELGFAHRCQDRASGLPAGRALVGDAEWRASVAWPARCSQRVPDVVQP